VQVKSINWFIPDFETPFYGGIHTILRFADYFRRKHNVKSRFVVLGVGPEEYVRSGLKLAFPALADSEVIICSPWNDDEIRALPGADVSIATQWLSAYVVSRVERTRRKFYLIQDFEPMFYPAGTVYALAEQTYRMGLYGIASGPTLRQMYEREYGGGAIHYNSCVDISLFHPGGDSERKSDDPFRLFLFGRPGHWRSCYELAMSALGILKGRWKDKLHIITAGSWAVSSDPVGASMVDNLGLLDYKATPDLYRSCDAGLVLTTSKNPSYVTLEMMASGSLVISNVNPAASWLLRDGENCLLAEPTAESLYQALEKGILDVELRKRLSDQAVADIREHHSDWEPEMERVYQYLGDPDALLMT
jgi:glycosyltransferase involved in cell wall biosynthesis